MLIIDLFSSRLHLIIKANPFSSHSFEYNSFFFFTCFRQFSQYKFPIVLALISSFLFSQLDKNKNVEAERGFTKNKNYRSIVHQKFSNLKSPFTLSSQNSLAINVPGTHANFASQHDAFVSLPTVAVITFKTSARILLVEVFSPKLGRFRYR